LNPRLIAVAACVLSCNVAAAQDMPAHLKAMADCLTPEQKQAYAKRILDTMAQAAASAAQPHAARFQEAQAASDRARAAYIGCIKTAKAADKAPAEACASEKKAFDDRLAAAMEPELTRAAEKVLAEFPACRK
jgi:hypothetical protein